MTNDYEFGIAVTPDAVAQIIHEAIRRSLRDTGIGQNLAEWKNLTSEYREFFADAVGCMLRARQYVDPHEVFEDWRDEMERHGWRHGEKYDPDLKTDPRIGPFEELPLCERLNQVLVIAMTWVAMRVLDSATVVARKRQEAKGVVTH